MLRIDDLVVRYGQSTALDGVNLQVAPGEMVALVGPNGAGKTTLANTLSGLLKPSAGSVYIDGRLAQVPEGRQLFADLSVADNLSLGAWRSRRSRAARDPRRVFEALPQLEELAGKRAGSLSGGQQQIVSVGRALMANPQILVVDELSLGLAPMVVADIATHLRQLNREIGMSILLIEQNANLAFGLCERAYVLETGAISASGSSTQLAQDPRVASAYLGLVDGALGGAE